MWNIFFWGGGMLKKYEWFNTPDPCPAASILRPGGSVWENGDVSAVQGSSGSVNKMNCVVKI